MANPEHLKILEQGVDAWNEWRIENPEVLPDLAHADFSLTNLSGADFRSANLSSAHFSSAYFNLTNLSNADLIHSDFNGTFLQEADFTGAIMGYTSFGDNDLSQVTGLERVHHLGPSSIGIDTIYKSQGNIPEVFLRGCGVPEEFIVYMRSLVVRPIQFYSCFISYSTKDEEFARRLYSRMRDEQLRVWFAPEEMKGGEKLHEQIDRAIQVHDKLLLILSEHSMRSEWVMTEVRRARRAEAAENRRKLFPISVVDFERIKTWERFDADTGRDLARELREYFIPDFSNWKDHDAFEAGFERLLRDLKAEEEKAGGG